MEIANRIKRYISRFFQKRKYLKHQRSTVIIRALGKKKILLYTDSRGINLHNHFDYKHYSTKLLMEYDVDAYLCPKKWTTILDFLQLWENFDTPKYDVVILHAGIVDASPRHQSVAINNIYREKEDIFDEVFGKSMIVEYLQSDLGCTYENEKTINMYSLEMAEVFLLPRLLKIPNLIWIGTNKIDTSWKGNYWKDRPKNIRLVERYSELFCAILPHNVDVLNAWSLDEIRLFTFDNVHPNNLGSDYIYQMLLEKIERLG